jgi:ketosteroid isomerase-like protein
MKNASLVAALLSALVAATSAEADDTCEPVTSGADVEAVRALEKKGADSNVDGWTLNEAKAFFAPEWVSLQMDGSVMKLDKVFEGFKNGRSQPWAQSFKLTELDVRVYCDTAIVIGLAEAQAKGPPDKAPTGKFRFLNVWRKQDGTWLYAANQFARF